jgi:hypothetical protein
MSSYFIATWGAQLRGAKRKQAETAIRAIDPTADLVLHNEAGNSVRMWLERPNDGTNDYNEVVRRNARLKAVVNGLLSN